MLKRILMGFALLFLISCPSWAGIITVNSESALVGSLQSGYLFENFNSYSYGSFIGYTLAINQNGYLATLSAANMLYSGNGNMSTNDSRDALVINFSNNVTAVGGYFWPTDLKGLNLIGNMTVRLSDGSLYTYNITAADSNTFRGFISDGASIQQIQIIADTGQAVNDSEWPTVDNLYAGTASVPEPALPLLLGIGIGAVSLANWLHRKKR